METALLEAASNGTLMSHMFLAHTYTYSSVSSQRVSLAVTVGIVLLEPDLRSRHAPFPLKMVTKLKHTKCCSLPMPAAQNFIESVVV